MLVALVLALQAQAGRIAVDRGWELSGANTRIETHRSIDAIRIDNGRAVRRDVSFENGTIEFDVELVPYRTFIYIQFRIAADGEMEEIYFRPHKSGLPDAVQYNPVWKGDSFWQLYHGPDASASPRFRFDGWTHVRLVVDGQRAALFVDSAATPTLVMNLARPPQPGAIAVRAFTPETKLPSGVRAAAFANVVVRPGPSGYSFPEPAARPTIEPGSILRWQISPAFKADTQALMTLPESLLARRATWPSYPTEPHGVVAIGRHMNRPRPDGAAIARLVIRSSGTRLQRLHLGYSDYVTVFVNGAPVFAGDAHYSYDQPRQEGLIGRRQAIVWLPLKDGENEVLLAVVDGFGGWGLTGRLEPGDGGVLVPTPN